MAGRIVYAMGYYTGKPSNRLYGFAVMQDFTTFFILFSCRLCFLTIKNTNALPDYKVLGRIASSWNGGRSRGQHALLVVKIPDWIFHPKKVKCLRRNKCKLETLLPLSLSGICWWLAVNNTSASICIYSKYHQRWISSSTAR